MPAIVAVQVLACNGYGSTSGIIDGLVWAQNDARQHPNTRAVFSMSLGGGFSTANKDTSLMHLYTLAASAIKERYLEEEGLFRISPSHADIQELEKMVEESEDGGQERLRALDKNSGMMEKPHLFCSTIKKYLRDLPDPVLCTGMSSQWMDLARTVTSEKESGEEQSTLEMKKLVAALPEHNQNLLAEVMDLALRVSEHSGKNLMTSENLSKVFGPNLLNDTPPNEYPALFDLVNHMIVHSKSIFSSGEEEEETVELPKEDEEMAEEPINEEDSSTSE